MPLSQTAAVNLFLDRLLSRSTLTEEEKSAVRGLKGHATNVRANVDFVRLGEQVDHSCLIIEGLVGRFGQASNGARQITCLYIPGDVADLHSVVSPKSGWGLMALSHTTILRVPHAALRRIAALHPGIAEAFWRDCVADGSILSEWVVNVGRRDSIARLAHLFCEMGIRSEQAGQGNRCDFPLPITQVQLGDATGLTSVHVNRTLREMKAQSIVSKQPGKIVVHDWDRLVAVGDFDAAFMLLDGPFPRFSEAA